MVGPDDKLPTIDVGAEVFHHFYYGEELLSHYTVIFLFLAVHLRVVRNYLFSFRLLLGQDGANTDFTSVGAQNERPTMFGVSQNRGGGQLFLELQKDSSTLWRPNEPGLG